MVKKIGRDSELLTELVAAEGRLVVVDFYSDE